MNFREFLEVLDRHGLLVRIRKPVDTKLEMSTLMKMLDGRPLLFENVKGHEMKVAANVFSSRELLAMGLGIRRQDLISVVARAIENPRPVSPEPLPGEYREVPPDLSKIPILLHYPFDGGPYISSGVVVARHPELGVNMSYHRMMVIDKDRVVMRILPRDFNEFLSRGVREFTICIGNQPAVALAAAISVELGKSELDIANALSPVRVFEFDGHIAPEAEIVMIAEMTGEEHDEGPFLDLTETPDIVRKQRVARIKRIFVREGAVYHALLPGGLEHKVLMGVPREPTIFREVSKVCECRDVLITPGGCSWLHAVVSIKKRAPDDGRKAIEAAFRGHRSLKHVWVVDDDIDIHDPHQVEWAMATRFQGDRDVVVKKEKGSSLDPSADPHTYLTTKMGFDLTIPWDKDPSSFKKPGLPMKLDPKDYL